MLADLRGLLLVRLALLELGHRQTETLRCEAISGCYMLPFDVDPLLSLTDALLLLTDTNASLLRSLLR
jgi:hypothetical protein